jgi:hypothetical protein
MLRNMHPTVYNFKRYATKVKGMSVARSLSEQQSMVLPRKKVPKLYSQI